MRTYQNDLRAHMYSSPMSFDPSYGRKTPTSNSWTLVGYWVKSGVLSPRKRRNRMRQRPPWTRLDIRRRCRRIRRGRVRSSNKRERTKRNNSKLQMPIWSKSKSKPRVQKRHPSCSRLHRSQKEDRPNTIMSMIITNRCKVHPLHFRLTTVDTW